MARRVVLVLLALALSMLGATPVSASAGDASTSADDGCNTTVADGTPVLLGSLLQSVTQILPGINTAAPVSPGSCDGVRPGAMVVSDTGQCTFNYLFTGDDGARYMGTAGHCILTAAGESAWGAGEGPEARDGGGARVGEFAYAVLGGVRDFALVRLDPGVTADPQMCHFGGPVGVNSDLTSGPVVLQHFGQGLALGPTLPARTGVALSLANPDQVFATALVLPGDSGGPVNSDDGRAIGVLVTLGIHLAGPTDTGLVGITRLGPQLEMAENALGTALELQTAPRL